MTNDQIRLRRTLKTKLRHAKTALNQRWLDECTRLLNDAGVPAYVCLVDDEVPSNSAPSRLKWFLLRRKNVQKWERDGLDKEMAAIEQAVKDLIAFK